MCRVRNIHTAHHRITKFVFGTITGGVTPRTVRIDRTALGAVASIPTTLAGLNKHNKLLENHTPIFSRYHTGN